LACATRAIFGIAEPKLSRAALVGEINSYDFWALLNLLLLVG
jgi:hypothetical protein